MNTRIIYRKKFFAITIFYLIVCLLLMIVFLYVVRSTFISVFLAIAMVLPVVFIPSLFKVFTREVIIELDPDQFSFKIMEKNEEVEKKIVLSELKSYSIQFPNDKFSFVRFWLRSGKVTEFSFYSKETEPNVDTSVLIDSFVKRIRAYNERPTITEKINLRPSFYATRMGLYCIIALSVFFLIGLLIADFYSKKAISLAFVFSFVLILQLILKRRKDLAYYNQMNE